MEKTKKLVIIGGGPAGFMAAIYAALSTKSLDISIYEQSKEFLGKVRISGGGRCNVTHACYDVKDLVSYYPRGSKELLSPFFQFNCDHTIAFFEHRNVTLKTEDDGRIFPVSDDSMSIVNCLLNESRKLGIKIFNTTKVLNIKRGDLFEIQCKDHIIICDYLLIASGSNHTIWDCLKSLKHSIVEPVPSLFAFNTKHNVFRGLSGISLKSTRININSTSFETEGIVLITHTGLSGPAILKLSAFAARYLATLNYHFSIHINWINKTRNEALEILQLIKQEQAKKSISNFAPFKLAQRFWNNCLVELKLNGVKQWAQLSKQELNQISEFLTNCEIPIHGKSTNKEEFVTAGGVALNEINFKTMESKIIPGLFFAGEVLDIDAVTGGFNFQAAWTTGYIAGIHIGR